MKAASPAAEAPPRPPTRGPREALGWLVPTLVIGYVAIVAGLLALHGIHQDEKRDALASLDRDEVALRRTVVDALAGALEAHLVDLEARVDRALADPFTPADDLLLIDRRPPTSGSNAARAEVVLPPRATASGPTLVLAVLRAEAQRDDTLARTALSEEVAAERLALGDALARAEAGVPLSLAADAWLDHRARFSLRAELDLPLAVRAIEALAARSALEPELARTLLRDGVTRPDGVVPGLMAAILRARDKLPLADLSALAARVVPIAKRMLVRTDDFEARLGSLAEPPLDPESLLASASTPFPDRALRLARDPIRPASAWVLEPETSPSRVLGVRVDVYTIIGVHRARLIAAGRMEDDAQIAASPLGAIRTTQFDEARREVEARAVLKAMPLVAVAILGLAVVALAIVLQRRRTAFIALRTHLLTAVTHELKTPLASIRALAETLEDKLSDTPAAKDYPHRIVQSAERLTFLIDNVLSFTRLEGGAWKPRLVSVPLVELDAMIDDFFANDLVPRARPVDLEVRVAPELLDQHLDLDRDLLFLMLSNLVDNAARYARAERVHVTITASPAARGVVLAVADDGPGLAGTMLTEASPRTGPGRARSTGLGLAICRAVMNLHDGRFRVARSDAHGTTFEATFPIRRPGGPA
ncbi:MAG: HAMP domain-containing histidine kinase [Deltaproteobacteria bacterium]|nr:HAMP domain-containing histidine kinase [Deltaproteobacteria bacterium]